MELVCNALLHYKSQSFILKIKQSFKLKEKIDLSLDRSLEELISSYWDAVNGEIDHTQYGSFYALENYLSDMGAI